jgi:hypothetical protein
VSVAPGKLTVTGWLASKTTHEVAPDAKIAIDGEPAKLDDIQPGDAVRVTTEVQGDQEVAVKIDAERAGKEEPAEELGDINPPLGPPVMSPIPGEPQEPPASQPDRPAAADEPENPAKPEADNPAQPGGDQPKPPADEQLSAPSPQDGAETLFHGKIKLVSPNLLGMQADADLTHLATEMTFTVTDDTEILIAGAPATFEDLSEGMTVTVIAKKNGDQTVAERIEADPMPA